jgi:hypothetical protein
MHDFAQIQATAERIARKEHIGAYRRLLAQIGSPFANHIELNKDALAVLLVSALLEDFSEQDIIRATEGPTEARTGAPAAPSAAAGTTAPAAAAELATAAVKKKPGRRLNSIREFTGTIWTTLSSGLRTLSSRTRSIWADGCGKLSSIFTTKKPLQNS